MAKQDFRQYLNAALEIYYNTPGTVVLNKAFEDHRIPFNSNTLWAISNTLEKDGHISCLHGYSQTPVGQITGQGKVFFEAGGYKDSKNRVDKMIHWFKDHKVFSILIFASIVITSLFGLTKMVMEVIQWFK